ncbi:PiggyBac transposable element-derived protein 4 [Elysia marginata]|uniref:PiggyBac transposable element-derived protein 4 n=1 Tax=Elysia marginata TaxID=1093978 RepID=A0AAV4FMM8_9GAST|nr:PiggyBac transposable element-derived protein 4 [Elysia marginata]
MKEQKEQQEKRQAERERKREEKRLIMEKRKVDRKLKAQQNKGDSSESEDDEQKMILMSDGEDDDDDVNYDRCRECGKEDGEDDVFDEQLVPWRGRCSFLPYLPSKPDKYGLKIFRAVDSETFFPLNAVPYLGKVGRNPTVNLGRNTALQLVEPFYRSGRNLTSDNFFTDYELAQKLNIEKMSVVGLID